MRLKFNVMNFLKLPIEIQDYIFLLCDFNALEHTRKYQSDYVKKCTEYFSFDYKLNKLNLQWLFYKNKSVSKASVYTPLMKDI